MICVKEFSVSSVWIAEYNKYIGKQFWKSVFSVLYILLVFLDISRINK